MSAHFDHEKLDVYRVELEFIRWVTDLLKEIKGNKDAETSEVRDHLDRASLSALLNTAEGNGKRIGGSRAKFLDDARGSARNALRVWMPWWPNVVLPRRELPKARTSCFASSKCCPS